MQPAAVHLNEMRRDRLRIWKITEDDWMHDIKWEICLTHKMEGSIGKSHLGFLSPRSGASTITMKKMTFFLYILSLPENSPFEQVLTQKYRHALLRRLWNMFLSSWKVNAGSGAQAAHNSVTVLRCN